MNKNGKRGLTSIIIILMIIGTLFLALINFITDLLWFREMGYVSVFLTQLFTELKIGIPLFLIIGILSFVYLQALKKSYYKKVESADNDAATKKKLNILAFALAVIFSGLITFFVTSQLWFETLKFTKSTDFSLTDPLFNMDISFYLFKLEFIKQLNNMGIGIIVAFAALAFVYYMLLMSFRRPQIFEKVSQEDDDDDDEERYTGDFQGGPGNFGAFGNINDILGKLGQAFMGGSRSPKPKKRFDDDNFMRLIGIASKQLIALGVIFFLMVGVNFFLKQYDLLYSSTGALYGAGFTDVNVTLWMYRVLVALSVLGAIGFVIGLSRKKFRTILTVPVIMIVVGAIGMGASYLVQNFIVSPDEISKESPYLARNIEYTQRAYNLNNVSIKNFSASSDLSGEDIANNSETISNIRINDYTPAKKFYNNVQTIRPYYTFVDVDADRYMVNGEYTQTFLSAREIDDTAKTSIPQTWINQHIKYTHGYGITLSRVDKITASGQPDMLIRNIPPVSQAAEIQISRPAIYFGEMTHDYVLVKTNVKEFDYPTDMSDEDGSNAETIYEGNAGIKLNFLNKVMFAIREKSLKILVSTNLTSDSKIVINRNIMQRVRTIMPRLSYDNDPYIVAVDGSLFWIIDAYTASSYYPYSEPYDTASTVNYIRNSVKVVVDAYNGDVKYYLVDDTDPIATTYKKIYPALFKDFSEMPESLKAHIRYPNSMLNIQANVYQRYHMSDVVVFYLNEDVWDIAKEIYETSQVSMIPNYYIMKLPGEEKAEFVNTIPYTPRNKLNMTGLLIARNDTPNYGELVLYRMPKSKTVYGPMQIEAMVDQNTEISKEFSLWSQAGSTYSRGNMFVIPVEDSLLYVEPVYLEATNSSIPEVKRVIVAYGEDIAYEATLAEALEKMFGKSTQGTQDEDIGSDVELPMLEGSIYELIDLATKSFDDAQAAQKDGDWAAYGQYLRQLENYLSEMKKTNGN